MVKCWVTVSDADTKCNVEFFEESQSSMAVCRIPIGVSSGRDMSNTIVPLDVFLSGASIPDARILVAVKWVSLLYSLNCTCADSSRWEPSNQV